jgi:hypothetical protein
MSERAGNPHDFFSPENDRFVLHVAKEQEPTSEFQLLPFDYANFPGERLAVTRAGTATAIKENLQKYTRLDGIVREFSETTTRGDYVWAIITDLGMTEHEKPTDSFRSLFEKVHDRAKDIKSAEIGDLMDKFEDHPVFGVLTTVENTSPGTTEIKKELVMLRRSLLVLLDEAS